MDIMWAQAVMSLLSGLIFGVWFSFFRIALGDIWPRGFLVFTSLLVALMTNEYPSYWFVGVIGIAIGAYAHKKWYERWPKEHPIFTNN